MASIVIFFVFNVNMSKTIGPESDKTAHGEVEKKKLTCGVIMPISEIDGCSAGHWKDVLTLIQDSAEDAEFDAKLVSEESRPGVIQAAIVQNIYTSDVVVCDVSAKNPNVMLELGMRLMFDKPTIIIKDDKTDYIFDTSPLAQVGYPRSLRHPDMVAFQKTLTSKLKAAISEDNEHSFLKTFGTISNVTLESKEVPQNEYILDVLHSMNRKITNLQSDIRKPTHQKFVSRKDADWINAGMKHALETWKEIKNPKRKGINSDALLKFTNTYDHDEMQIIFSALKRSGKHDPVDYLECQIEFAECF